MKLQRIEKSGIGSGPKGPVNELKLVNPYPSAAQIATDTPQHIHGLRSLLKTYATLFKNVDPFASPESVQCVGVNFGQRVAVLITKYKIPFKTVESTLRELVSADKAADLADPKRMMLGLDILASECRKIKPEYSIS